MSLHELTRWTTLIDLTANLIQLATFALALRAVFSARRTRSRHESTGERGEDFLFYSSGPLTRPLRDHVACEPWTGGARKDWPLRRQALGMILRVLRWGNQRQMCLLRSDLSRARRREQRMS